MNVEDSYEYFQHSTQYASNMCHIHMNKAHSTHIHIYHRWIWVQTLSETPRVKNSASVNIVEEKNRLISIQGWEIDEQPQAIDEQRQVIDEQC